MAAPDMCVAVFGYLGHERQQASEEEGRLGRPATKLPDNLAEYRVEQRGHQADILLHCPGAVAILHAHDPAATVQAAGSVDETGDLSLAEEEQTRQGVDVRAFGEGHLDARLACRVDQRH